MFSTQRLRLRAYQPSDFEALLQLDLHNRHSVASCLFVEGYITPLTGETFKETQLAFFQKCLLFCVAEEHESGAFVGMAVLFEKEASHKNRNLFFGISIIPESQNSGYGAEITRFMVDYAFRSLDAHRISLGVFSANDRAIHMYKKIGFVEEGRIRESVWIDGIWQDQIRMGILDEDWLSLNAGKLD